MSRRRPRWKRRLGGLLLVAAAAVAVLAWKPDLALEAEFARQRLLAGAERHEAAVAGHRWAYLEAGPREAPLLVLVHGLTGSKENWLPLMRELRADYRLVAPDLPGWGESERRADADYGVSAQAERVAAFIDTLGASPVLLAGHSMGGHVAGLVAAERPDRVPRLLLMSAAGVRFEDNDFSRAIAAGHYPYAVRDRAGFRAQLRLIFTDPPFVPWPADLAMARRRAADLPFELAVVQTLHRGEEAFLLHDRLHEVRASTLLLWCRDDRVIDVSSVPLFAAGLARSEAVILEGCGHMPLMARPAEVAAAIRRFVDTP